jgi:plastocyanin
MTCHAFALRIRAAAAGAALVLLSTISAPAAAAPHTYTVTIAQMRYGPLPANISVGDTIIWANKDTVPHTVTSKDHKFDLRIAAGKQASMTLSAAGNFAFYCIYHPAMRGQLKVTAGR